MSRHPRSRRLGYHYELPPRWRWTFWPVVAAAGGGTAIGLWLDDDSVTAAECVLLVAVPGMAALLYWFNHFVFKATRPRHEDPTDRNPLREKPQ